MSDRTPSSVRTGVGPAEGAAQADGTPRGAIPDTSRSVSTTQAIPTTGAQRAQGVSGPGTGATPRGPMTGGAPAQAAPRGVPAGRTAASGQSARGGRVRKSGRGPRRAKLQLRHIDTWSAFKISLVLSIALFFIWMVAVGVLYGVLSGLGVFNTLNDLFGQLGSANGSKSTGGNVITPGVVFLGAGIIGGINVVLLTALGTVATFIYNLCSDLVGGLEVTLSERD